MSYIAWLRRRVGRRKIFLVFATVVLQDEDGRVLLQRRADFDWWGLPGGALELDEDIEGCARRELREETGYEAGPLRLLGVYTEPEFDVTYPNGDKVQPFTFCFAGTVQGGQPRPDGVETTGQQFFDLATAVTLPLPPWYRAMLADLPRPGRPAFSPPFARDKVVDQIRDIRPFIGHDWLIAPGASVAVVRDDGCILMVRRADNGQWALPAGYCDLGENVAHTAVRETWEETGYHIRPERIIGVYSHDRFRHTFPNGDQVKNVGVTFRARLLSGTPELDSAELKEMAWMPLPVAERAISAGYRPYFDAVWRHLHQGVVVG